MERRKTKSLRKLEIKAGILVLLFGAIIFIVGILNLNNFVSFIESLSNNEFIQIVIICLFFTLLSAIPMGLYWYVEGKRGNPELIDGVNKDG